MEIRAPRCCNVVVSLLPPPASTVTHSRETFSTDYIYIYIYTYSRELFIILQRKKFLEGERGRQKREIDEQTVDSGETEIEFTLISTYLQAFATRVRPANGS